VWILLTAAHVADEAQKQTLYAPHSRAGGFVRLDRFWTSDAPLGVRADDRLDFAWCMIAYEHVADILNDYTALNTSQIETDDDIGDDSYGFFGYHGMDWPAQNVPPQLKFQGYVGHAVTDANAFRKLRVNPFTHVLIHWNENNSISLDGSRRKIQPPSPSGLSGGGVWKLVRNRIPLRDNEVTLAGIIIEHINRPAQNMKFLLATRINFWFGSIGSALRSLYSFLPKFRDVELFATDDRSLLEQFRSMNEASDAGIKQAARTTLREIRKERQE
jgi:hypothetical protein